MPLALAGAARGRRRGRATSTRTACRSGSTGRPAPRPGVVVHLHGGGFVFHDVDVHDAAVPPAREPARHGGPQRRLPAGAGAPVPGRAGRRRHGARLARPRGGGARPRRADVRPRRQRRRQPRAGRGAAPPGPVRGGGADLPVPGPDRPGFDVLRARCGRGLRPARGAWYWQQYAAGAGGPDQPRPGAAAVGPARHPAADAGRHRRARPAARRGRAPRRSWLAEAGGRRSLRPATSARSTASGGTTRCSRRPRRCCGRPCAFLRAH